MICCKIIADFNNQKATFQNCLVSLAKRGDVRWELGELFFSDTIGDTQEKHIIKVLKKNGYTRYYIECYDKNNQPHETDDSINSWLLDKLMKISYKQYEDQSQKLFCEISKGLDALDEQLNNITSQEKLQQPQTSKEGD